MVDEKAGQGAFAAYNSYSDQVLHGKYIKKDVTASYVLFSLVWAVLFRPPDNYIQT